MENLKESLLNSFQVLRCNACQCESDFNAWAVFRGEVDGTGDLFLFDQCVFQNGSRRSGKVEQHDVEGAAYSNVSKGPLSNRV